MSFTVSSVDNCVRDCSFRNTAVFGILQFFGTPLDSVFGERVVGVDCFVTILKAAQTSKSS